MLDESKDWLKATKEKAPKQTRFIFEENLGKYIFSYNVQEFQELMNPNKFPIVCNRIPSMDDIDVAMIQKWKGDEKKLDAIKKEFEKIITLYLSSNDSSFNGKDMLKDLIKNQVKEININPDQSDTEDDYLIITEGEDIDSYFEKQKEWVSKKMGENDIMYDVPSDVRNEEELDKIDDNISEVNKIVQECYNEKSISNDFLILNIAVIQNIINKEEDEDDDDAIKDTVLTPEEYFSRNEINLDLRDISGQDLKNITILHINHSQFFHF